MKYCPAGSNILRQRAEIGIVGSARESMSSIGPAFERQSSSVFLGDFPRQVAIRRQIAGEQRRLLQLSERGRDINALEV